MAMHTQMRCVRQTLHVLLGLCFGWWVSHMLLYGRPFWGMLLGSASEWMVVMV